MTGMNAPRCQPWQWCWPAARGWWRGRRPEREHADGDPAPGRQCKVLFHDAVRPFIDADTLSACFLALVNRLMPKSEGKVVLHSIPFLEGGTGSVVEGLPPTTRRPVVLVDGEVPTSGPPGMRLVRRKLLVEMAKLNCAT